MHAWTTEGGAGVKFVEARGLPIVDIILRFKAGTAQDTVQPGLAALTLYMLDEGSQHFTATEQADQLERLGAIVDKQVRLEHATLSLRSLSTSALLEPALELLIDLVACPTFPPSALENMKQQLILNNATRERQPFFRMISEAYRHLFHSHPYGNPLGSTREGIEGIAPADLKRFHQRGYCASNLEMVVVGDLSWRTPKQFHNASARHCPKAGAPLNSPSFHQRPVQRSTSSSPVPAVPPACATHECASQ